MKRHRNWYTDDTGRMFFPRPYSRWERRHNRQWRVRLLFAAMCLCFGMFVMWRI